MRNTLRRVLPDTNALDVHTPLACVAACSCGGALRLVVLRDLLDPHGSGGWAKVCDTCGLVRAWAWSAL